MPSSSNSLALGAFVFVTGLYLRIAKRTEKKEETLPSKVIRPPFPPVIRDMLSSARLAYLSTVDDNSSHLSLMRFTFLNDEEDGEVVILTTQRKTKKFNILQKQDGVALLIHDFSQQGDGSDGMYSITLNGRCEILPEGEKAEKYRAAHLKNNKEYSQFILGDDIAVLVIFVTYARICNIHDQVTKWSVQEYTS